MTATATRSIPEPIAIIGIGCRFPGGADDPESFWRLLRDGVDAIVEVPPDRWSTAAYYHPNSARRATAVTRWGGFLRQRIDEFDAHFFGISPREAAHLDPMQRWILETAWEALEDGGQVPERLAGSSTGVFVGAFTEDVKIFWMNERNRELFDAHTGTGAAMTMVANRLSYLFDFHGPSVALDTACSSSLVAVHLACQSLWNGECALALAGGVNAMFKPEYTIVESKAGMLSPDGRCKTFDARANGYVRGEGAGIVLLKPLSRARADGDPIYALIRGTAVNQDGHTNGITVPSHDAQKALMEAACRRAGISPGQLQYVEAHGTGTPVGDPIEANALAAALASARPDGERCAIGSVKTNLGHLEAAAGVAGLIKTVLCLTHRQIPPHLHLQELNPQIPLDDLCIRIPRTLEAWPDGPRPALAAVNSFGFGGTNAHVILEEAPSPASASERPSEEQPAHRAELVPLSARSPEALRAYARRYGEYTRDGSTPLQDVAYTASMRRSHHNHRLAVVAHSTEELAARLDAYASGEACPGMTSGRKAAGRAPRLVFVCSGMGPQWWAMGRELLAQEPVFRAVIERCDALLRTYSGWSLLDELTADEAGSRMAETRIAQPANFALQVALAALWRSWGVEPDAIVGHSAGEVAAAYLAGAMSLEEATRVIYHRSRLQHQTTGQGRLVAVGLPLDEATRALAGYEDRVSIAAVNSPSAVTLVGDPDALDEIVAPLQQREIFCRFLKVAVPYHSHYMDPLRDELLDVLRGLDLRATTLPLYSTVTGTEIDGRDLNAGYWWRNVREPVLFARATDRLIEAGHDVFLELSPHPVLVTSIKECLAQREQAGTTLASLRRQTEERATMLESLGTLYALGYPVDFGALHSDGGRVVRLPAYPWQRERYWEESAESAQDRLGQPVHPLLGRRAASVHPAWDSVLDAHSVPFLRDHQIQGAVVYPGAAFVEMGMAATRHHLGDDTTAVELRDVEFRKALFLPDDADAALHLLLHPRDLDFDVYSRARGGQQGWTHHAHGRACRAPGGSAPAIDLATLQSRCTEEIPATECYRLFAAMGLHYGPCFQGIERLWVEASGTGAAGEALAQVGIPTGIAADVAAYHTHPATLDVCFQTLITAISGASGRAGAGAYMPVGIERLHVYGRPSPRMWVHTRLVARDASTVTGEFRLCDDAGNVIVAGEGLKVVALEERAHGADRLPDLFYGLRWEPVEQTENSGDSGEAAQRPPVPGTGGRWLIFTDDRAGRALAALLEERGDRCVMVRPADAYRRSEQGHDYWINPACPDDMRRLFADAFGGGQPCCRGVAHLWGLEAATLEGADADALSRAETLGCISVLHAVQALEQTPWREAPRLWLVTRGAQAVTVTATVTEGSEPVSVAQAPLWGLARTIGHQEHSGLWGGIIDLDPETPDGEAAMLCADMLQPGEADQRAFRDGRRYAPVLERRRELARAAAPLTFRPDGAYLITGGLGGLGLEVARWMVDQGARRLILLGRTPLPPRSEWNDVAEGASLATRIAAIRALESMGASIHLAAADVADDDDLAAFLDDYRRDGWPPIRGVVHSAGVTHSQLLLHMDARTFTNVLRPKVHGAWLLHHLLREEPLDFFVLFSSVASLGFSMGLGAYAAGNAFLDALAHHRRAQGLPALSVNWGPWAEVGMASQPDLSAYFAQRGLNPLAPDQGIQALAQLIGRDSAQVAVASANWPLIRQNGYAIGHAPPMLSALLAEDAAEDAPADGVPEQARIRTDLAGATDPDERQRLAESYLLALVARVLRLSAADLAGLDTSEALNSLGIDSLIAVELKNAIESDLGAIISVVTFLEGASLSHLAGLVLERLPAEADEAAPATEAPIEDTTEQLAARVDDLSEAEVDALLSAMLAEEAVTNG